MVKKKTTTEKTPTIRARIDDLNNPKANITKRVTFISQGHPLAMSS